MIVYILMIVVQLKTAEGFSTQYLLDHFGNRQECEIAEGTALTAAINQDEVTGYAVVHDCDTPLDIPKKA